MAKMREALHAVARKKYTNNRVSQKNITVPCYMTHCVHQL